MATITTRKKPLLLQSVKAPVMPSITLAAQTLPPSLPFSVPIISSDSDEF